TQLYREALQRFQQAGDQAATMQTYNLLGVAERKAGRLEEARAWYVKSHELAAKLNDQRGVSAAAQNLGIVCELEGENARARGDESAERRNCEEARQLIEKSLGILQKLENKLGEANSLSELGRIHFLFADFLVAERYAQSSREIREPLGLTEVFRDYHTLSEI